MSGTLWAGRLVAVVAGVVVGLVIFCVLALVMGTVFPLLGIATPGLYNEVEAISADIDPGSAGEIVYEENYGTGAGVTPHHEVIIAGPDAYEAIQDNLRHAGFSSGSDSADGDMLWKRDPGDGFETAFIWHVDANQPIRVGNERLTVADEGVVLEIYE